MNHTEEYMEDLKTHVQVWTVPSYRPFRIATSTKWDDMTEWEQEQWDTIARRHYDREFETYQSRGGHKKCRA